MSTHTDQFRLFCAIELPHSVRDRLIDHISRLREMVPDTQASWSREANLHLTIKFLGNVDVNRVSNVLAAASRAVADMGPFPISLAQTGAFPKSGTPRVLWIGIEDGTGKLAQLNACLEKECAVEGFPQEQRTFHPHLTLARLRKPAGARELAEAHKQLNFEAIEVAVLELAVIRSELSSKGSQYTKISGHELL